jgi:hypothetical protein
VFVCKAKAAIFIATKRLFLPRNGAIFVNPQGITFVYRLNTNAYISHPHLIVCVFNKNQKSAGTGKRRRIIKIQNEGLTWHWLTSPGNGVRYGQVAHHCWQRPLRWRCFLLCRQKTPSR